MDTEIHYDQEIALTGDKFFNELDDPECQLEAYGANANICNLGSHKFYLWTGRRPHRVTFQISSETDEATLLSVDDCLQQGLIKWLGSVKTTKETTKNLSGQQ